ncbi:MAG TPA: arginase family protein [Gemmataceae bacterium]|nr:arginase family protein [Gemmataceae bacterium]
MSHSSSLIPRSSRTKTTAVFFPFDLFGSGGAGAGAQLLADAFQEMLADNRREKVATRARAYAGKVRFQEFTFETMDDYRDWRSQARKVIRQALERGDFLLWIAGNHLGVLPLYEELTSRERKRPEESVVVQFDAHLDIYNLADCTKELSHGNFLLHADGPLPGLINVGHRELLLRPEYVSKYYRQTFSAADLAVNPEPALAAVREAAGRAGRVFLDLDCDVFDPAYFPGMAHPLPFGISPQLFLRFLDAAWSDNVAGLAISEFEPNRDQNDRSLATLIWLIEYVLLRRYECGERGSAGARER